MGAACLLSASAAFAHAQAPSLADLSLEELANVRVTSVSGRRQSLAEAAASVYVISGDDIRRAGSTSLPEALRLAPNLDVARVDANQYVVTSRGFASTAGNKLLVLIDGRTVYTPLFSGTFWDAQDVMLEDVDRIEIISGPGATLWGANAVNGVINVVTRPASETQGALAAAGAGNRQRDVAARYGSGAPGGHWRGYAKRVRREDSMFAGGRPAGDRGAHTQAGVRFDGDSARGGITLQGDVYQADTSALGLAREFSGVNILGRWRRALDAGGEVRLQGYIDRTLRRHSGLFEETLDTYDLELQHAAAAAGGHQVLWGVGAREFRDDVVNSPTLIFIPPRRSFGRRHVFVQDELALSPFVAATLGAKLEHNTFSGAEFLPSARIGWRPSSSQLAWAAASRTVRAPSRIDREFQAPLNPPPVLGSADFRSEVAKVIELGYRAQPTRSLSYSATIFTSRYDGLRSLAPVPGGSVIANGQEAKARGAEAWATWRPRDAVRLSAGAVLQKVDIRAYPGTVNLAAPGTEGNDPRSWYKLRASLDVGPRQELDLLMRHVASRPAPFVPAYTALDARFGWRPAREVEVAVIGQNLLDGGHAEFGPPATRSELGRALLLRVRVGH